MYKTNEAARKARFLKDNPLLREFLLTFSVGLIGIFLMSPLSATLSELSYGLSADVETKGGFLDAVCSVASQVCFYLTGLLSTVLLFIGASFSLRLLYRGRTAAAVKAGGILFLALSLSPCVSFIAYAIIKLKAENPQSLTMTDGAALLGQIGFAFLRVLLLLLTGFLCVNHKKKPVRYPVGALLCAAVMTLFSVGIEAFDTLLPILKEGNMTASEIGSACLSLLIYLIHGTVGFGVLLYAGRIEVGKKETK